LTGDHITASIIVSTKFVREIYADIRKKLAESYYSGWEGQLLPRDDVYEIDESLLTHAKNLEGSRTARQVWVVGIIGRFPRLVRVEVV